MKRLSLFVVCVCLSQFAFAKNSPPACPSVDVVRTVIFNQASEGMFGWMGYKQDYFLTPQEWFLGVFAANATNEVEAVKQANVNVKLISLFHGPEDQNGAWVCMYSDGNEAGGYAMTKCDSSK